MDKYLSIIRVGVKEFRAYPNRILFSIFNRLLLILILTSVWSHFVKGDFLLFLRYFVLSQFIVNVYTLSTDIRRGYVNLVIRGWNPFILKPIRFSIGIFMENLGYEMIDTLIAVVTAVLLLYLTGFTFGIHILLLPIVLLLMWFYDMMSGYLIGGLSYYTYRLWGFNVIWNMLSNLLGGGLVPLWVFPEASRILLEKLPFPFRYYYMTQFLLTGEMSYLIIGGCWMLVWGVVFGLIGYLLHTFGWKRFESQGG